MRSQILRGRVWVLAWPDGRLIEDIDTDQIFHNSHLHITEISQMGAYALGNLEGWKDFPQKAKPGDILVAGRNFGAGSSRQQAVDCFVALGVKGIMAPSFSAIYFRNAVNAGFPVLRSEGLERPAAEGLLRSGDEIEIDLSSGRGRNVTRNESISFEPMSAIQAEIYEAGNVFRLKRS
ncbi:MAG: 3-isopropylmalate dehydratase [Candidatus Aminicenantes bacterium]|nr:3-isopropylmalate dehydratase [Candidatus Aminicenantes bacterium]